MLQTQIFGVLGSDFKLGSLSISINLAFDHSLPEGSFWKESGGVG